MLQWKCYTCSAGYPHQVSDGTPLDADHSCAEGSATAMLSAFLRTALIHKMRWSCMGCRHSYHSGTKSCPKSDCQAIRGHTLYEVEMVLVERLSEMLIGLVSWDPVLDTSSDCPELLSGSMMAEMLLSPHNRNLTGLLAGAWDAVDEEDNPGTSRCVELKAIFSDREQTAMDVLNQDEVEVIIPLIQVATTKSLIILEVISRVN